MVEEEADYKLAALHLAVIYASEISKRETSKPPNIQTILDNADAFYYWLG